jgi:hypothetical protein
MGLLFQNGILTFPKFKTLEKLEFRFEKANLLLLMHKLVEQPYLEYSVL